MKEQAEIVIYTKTYCPYCIRAKQLLNSLELDYHEISVDGKPQLQDHMAQLAGRRTVPQIFINGNPIGGCDEMFALYRAGEFEAMVVTAA